MIRRRSTRETSRATGGALAGKVVMRLALIAVLAAGLPSALAAQAASPWLRPNHWTRSVLARLHARGASVLDPARMERSLLDALRVLPPPYAERLAAERSWTLSDAAERPLVHAEMAALMVTRTHAVSPGGFTLDREWTGPTPLPDLAAPGVRLRIESVLRPWLAVTAMGDVRSDAARVDHGTADLAFGGIGLWAGRRRIGYAPGEAGGLVLNRIDRFDGAGVRLARPARLPVVGPLTGELFAGPLGANGHVASPWLIGMRAHFRPHTRLDVGVTRAIVFGGMAGAEIGLRQVALALAGANLSGDYADDQVASVDARWRPPVPAPPLEIYGEWGMHDIDLEVLVDMPTFTLGIRLPRLLRLPDIGMALEHTRISESCCRNPPWYHHFELANGWTANRSLLGHPLGGHGSQWRLTVSGDAGDADVIIDAAAILRSRGPENLLAPDREGRAVGLDLAADARLAPSLSAGLELLVERGNDWYEVRSELVGRWTF